MTAALPSTDAVLVVGAGAMGAGIAQVAAAAGHETLLYDVADGAAQKARARMDASLQKRVDAAKMEAADKVALMSRVRVVTALNEAAHAVLVIEAIVEDMGVKRALFAELESLLGPTAILATNTSSLSITAIAAGLEKPQRVVGMHFFNPAPVMKLVEVIAGLATDDAVTVTVFETARAWGKKPVHAAPVPGFIVNRVARPFYSEAFQALQEGVADAATTDHLLRTCGGFRMGPLELTDLIGQDVNAAVTRSVFDAYSGRVRFIPSLIQEELLAAGRLGRKTGQGIYSYDGGERPGPLLEPPRGKAPTSVDVCTGHERARDIIAAAKTAGMRIVETSADLPPATIVIGDTHVRPCGGTSAGVMASTASGPLIVYDAFLSWDATQTIAIAACDDATDEHVDAAVGFFQALGKSVAIIDDRPGMIVLRTLAMLANVAADAVVDRVASPNGIDDAMRYGANYPVGPLRWAQDFGASQLERVLNELADATGEERYRPSVYIQRCSASGRALVPLEKVM